MLQNPYKIGFADYIAKAMPNRNPPSLRYDNPGRQPESKPEPPTLRTMANRLRSAIEQPATPAGNPEPPSILAASAPHNPGRQIESSNPAGNRQRTAYAPQSSTTPAGNRTDSEPNRQRTEPTANRNPGRQPA